MRSALLFMLACAGRSASLPATAAPPDTRFVVTYADEVPPEARRVIDEAASRWATLVSTSVPVRVHVSWIFGNGPQGFAGPNLVRDFERARDGAYYPSALADALSGRDLQPGLDDMNLFFKETDEWHFGDGTGVPEGRVDFLTVAMHEIGHGLGLTTLAYVPWDGGTEAALGLPNEGIDFFDWTFPVPELDGTATVYDRLVHDASGQPITELPNESAELYRALTGALTFHGPRAMALHGGPLPIDASSVSHLSRDVVDEADPDWMMVPDTGRGVVQPMPGDLTLAILEDLGWSLR
ncbi:MAG: hypothetical protein AAF602_21050 [Myxococcota bacterium]